MIHPLAKAIAALSSNATNQIRSNELTATDKNSARDGYTRTQAIKHVQLFMESDGDSNKNGAIFIQCKKSVHDKLPFFCVHVGPRCHQNNVQQREVFALQAQKDISGAAEMHMQLNCQVGVTMQLNHDVAAYQVNRLPLPKTSSALHDEREEDTKVEAETAEESKDGSDIITQHQVSLQIRFLACAARIFFNVV